MKSTLIKDTTKSERIELVKQWEESEGCESSGIDLWNSSVIILTELRRFQRSMQHLQQDTFLKFLMIIQA